MFFARQVNRAEQRNVLNSVLGRVKFEYYCAWVNVGLDNFWNRHYSIFPVGQFNVLSLEATGSRGVLFDRISSWIHHTIVAQSDLFLIQVNVHDRTVNMHHDNYCWNCIPANRTPLLPVWKRTVFNVLQVIHSRLNASVIFERNEARLEGNKTHLTRNETRSGNLHLSGTVAVRKLYRTWHILVLAAWKREH